jgi:hypothetical protein
MKEPNAFPYIFWSLNMFKMKSISQAVIVTMLSSAGVALAQDAFTGPSTTTAPYVKPLWNKFGVTTQSLLTVGDAIGGYRMAGLPDGLGAYDNGNGTFTVLMTHEISASLGVTRAHGGKGTFVSKWVINKDDLRVLTGSDLMRAVYRLNGGVWEAVPNSGPDGQTSTYARFCSADLPAPSAFYDATSRTGTRARIFMTGEETSPVYGRGMAHVATGVNAGASYELPWAGEAVKAGWENLVASPYAGAKTVVIGPADGGTNGVYVYVGEKRATGNDIEKAGLVGGNLYRIAVNGAAPETVDADAGLGLATDSATGHLTHSFTLVSGADTTNTASTKFLRPEDGAWDVTNHNRFYFVTTNQMDAAKDGNKNTDITAGQEGRSRLWALNFANSANPSLGGTIELLLDGTVADRDYQMFDNITVNDNGTLTLQEDVGGNQHNGKQWIYNPKTGSMWKVTAFDTTLFGDIGVTGTVTKDEETSGVIDITRILRRNDGKTYNLLVAQSHKKSTDPELVEDGQLLVMSYPRNAYNK